MQLGGGAVRSWGRRGAGCEGTGRAVETVCAAVHRWWPVRGGGGACVGRQRTRERWLSEERECRGVGFVASSPAFTFTETPRLPRGWLRSTLLPDDRLHFLVRALGADCGIATALRTHCRAPFALVNATLEPPRPLPLPILQLQVRRHSQRRAVWRTTPHATHSRPRVR